LFGDQAGIVITDIVAFALHEVTNLIFADDTVLVEIDKFEGSASVEVGIAIQSLSSSLSGTL